MRSSLFIEEIDGPTFSSMAEREAWWAFESPYALAAEAEEYRQMSRPGC